MEKEKRQPQFGDVIKVEMLRHGAPNEYYLFQVIRQYNSSTYLDVPVASPERAVVHDGHLQPIVQCVSTSFMDDTLYRFRVADVTVVKSLSAREKLLVEALKEAKAYLVIHHDETEALLVIQQAEEALQQCAGEGGEG